MKFLSIFKKEPKGYLILILNTGYERIPNVKCQIAKENKLYFDFKDNYWYHNKISKTIPLYKRDVEKLIKKGFDISTNCYLRSIGYDEVLKYSKKTILQLIN